MEIETAVQPSQTVNASNTSSTSSTSALSATSDFETFLTLLTAQLENQDPLNPLESTDFVAQLASFSAVEQQILTNTNLSEIMESLSTNRTSDAAQWLGREVLAPAAARFEGEPIDVTITPDGSASRSQIEIRNAENELITTLPVSSGATVFSWDGKLAGGGIADPGSYRFSVVSFEGDDVLNSTPGRVFTEVTEVRLDQAKTYLVFEDGSQINMAEASRFRS